MKKRKKAVCRNCGIIEIKHLTNYINIDNLCPPRGDDIYKPNFKLTKYNQYRDNG